MMGKPVVESTRATVEAILEELGAGETIERILEAHPRLTSEGVLAAVRSGVEVLRADVAFPVSKSVAPDCSPTKASTLRSSLVCVLSPAPAR